MHWWMRHAFPGACRFIRYFGGSIFVSAHRVTTDMVASSSFCIGWVGALCLLLFSYKAVCLFCIVRSCIHDLKCLQRYTQTFVGGLRRCEFFYETGGEAPWLYIRLIWPCSLHACLRFVRRRHRNQLVQIIMMLCTFPVCIQPVGAQLALINDQLLLHHKHIERATAHMLSLLVPGSFLKATKIKISRSLHKLQSLLQFCWCCCWPLLSLATLRRACMLLLPPL
jgi:hypothetical protein